MKTGTVLGIGCGSALLIGLICAGIFGGLGYFGFRGIQELNQTGDAFLAKCGSGDLEGAYRSGSGTLQAGQSLERFKATADRLGLTKYRSVSWNSFNRVNDSATLSGSLTMVDGQTTPITMTLVKEGGSWKVSEVQVPAFGGGTKQDEGKPIPSDAEISTLAKETLLSFNAAVKAGDFTQFHGEISELWKREVTPQKFNELFAQFIEKQVDLGEISMAEPVFDKKPALDADGFLLLDGYVPTKTLKVHFTLRYTYEHPEWKLVSIRVKTS